MSRRRKRWQSGQHKCSCLRQDSTPPPLPYQGEVPTRSLYQSTAVIELVCARSGRTRDHVSASNIHEKRTAYLFGITCYHAKPGVPILGDTHEEISGSAQAIARSLPGSACHRPPSPPDSLRFQVACSSREPALPCSLCSHARGQRTATPFVFPQSKGLLRREAQSTTLACAEDALD